MVTIAEEQRTAPFRLALAPGELERPIEVHSELEGYKPKAGSIRKSDFKTVNGDPRDTLYLILRPREQAAAAVTAPSTAPVTAAANKAAPDAPESTTDKATAPPAAPADEPPLAADI